MIEVEILFVLPSELTMVKEYFLKTYTEDDYKLKFLSIDDKNLVEEIKDSDIQVIVIDKTNGYFTVNMYEQVDKNYMLVFFYKDLKVKLNNLTQEDVRSFKHIQDIKKVLNTYSEVDSDIGLIKNIEEYLDNKIPEILRKKVKPTIDTTYLDAIKITDYFSIKNMEIENLLNQREIYFVGENGDGKTVLLQAIALALKGQDKDYVKLAYDYIEDTKEIMELSTKDEKYPSEYKNYKKVKNLFAYGINRNKFDEERLDKSGYSGLFDTPNETTYLKKTQDFLKQESEVINEFVISIEYVMNNKLKILRSTDKVEFYEVGSETPINFNMLSEGYKTTLIWLCDLLSRLMENQKNVEVLANYKAIVLIDEVDLYLHPKWKYDFMYKLRRVFPNIQFIMTTHSLVTVLGASEDAVFYKVYKEEGNTKISAQIDDISHYTANVLITSPMFNLDSVKVRGYPKEERLSSDDYIYSQIHSSVKSYMKDNPSVLDDELKQKIRDELQKQLASLKK